MTLKNTIWRISSLLLCLLTVGCSSKNSEFFILNPEKLSNIQQPKTCRNIIMIERVKIPGYIDKPEIVTRMNKNQLIQAEFHRWAEPLSGNIGDVIAQNLSQQLKRDWIVSQPRLTTSPINYYVALKINQFDVDSTGLSILKVTWSIYSGKRKLVLTKSSSYYSYAQDPNNYMNITCSMNKNITALSADLAFYLKRLSCGRKPN